MGVLTVFCSAFSSVMHMLFVVITCFSSMLYVIEYELPLIVVWSIIDSMGWTLVSEIVVQGR
ncbi:hypothetical protein CPB84DRAFT_1785689 [Gymnopilus junonius]|uniref:Uncharacterized protein n=1 Tax=Gymnopilus junonius TaxID=109634 RepID=A0A9P5NHQ6_GYMJU|nr:hypothetical protein CPB84DRAFT_1785689 [Gymnopilus junonius]